MAEVLMAEVLMGEVSMASSWRLAKDSTAFSRAQVTLSEASHSFWASPILHVLSVDTGPRIARC